MQLGAIGAAIVWTGALSGLWNAAGNWDPATVPPGGAVALEFPNVARKTITNNVDLSGSLPLEIRIQASGYGISGNAIPSCGIDASYMTGSSSIGTNILTHASCTDFEVRVAGTAELQVSGTWPAVTTVKTGTGTLRGGFTFAFPAALTIRDGGVIAHGNSAVTAVVLDGGTIGGDGTVGTITGGNGGVSPGPAVALMMATPRSVTGIGVSTLSSGNVSLGAGTTVTIEINGAASADRLNVTGTVNLGGATLSTSLGYAPAAGSTTFTIITNDGVDAVVGTFAGLAEGATFALGGRTVQVSYAGGTGNDVTLTILPSAAVTLTVSPAALPAMTVGTAVAQTITAAPGTAPYTFAVTAGALPAGLALSTGGALTGTPTAAGAYNVTVTATDAAANTGTRAYTGTIGSATVGLTITPPTLPAITVGVPFSQTITATGGTAPYSFAITAGELPAGLTFTADGLLSGTPTTAQAYAFTVTATDSGIVATLGGKTAASSASLAYSGFVAAPVPSLPAIAFGALALLLFLIVRQRL
jgi:hypothetical protein